MTTSLHTNPPPLSEGESSRSDPVIRAVGLTKAFDIAADSGSRALPWRRGARDKKFLAVNDVSFEVAPGELFVIMGLSGSGKSTLLRLLNRLIPPTSGELLVGGRNVSTMGDAELRQLRNKKINMVFQHFALFPHRTLRENAAYGLQVRGVSEAERRERAEWALKTVGLGDRADAYPSELSGGQRQRVGLARALATDAEVLLMDEPFSALDPLIRREMQDLLMTLQQDLQRTIVFVTHDLNEAMRLGDRIMVMRGGRVVQLGTGEEILSHPANDYVSEFVSDVDRSRVITAGSVMRRPIITAQLGDNPADVLHRLAELEAAGVYGLDGDGVIRGAASNDTLSAAVRSGTATVRDCLTDDFRYVSADTPLMDCCELVSRHSVPLAVTDSDGRLLGVVPKAALLAALSNPRKASHD
ncbi:glycine betaine/L-proline ABC transporter ATP-binding protein [Streptomyces tuirus]|uniref:Glycine betaine/L-proline ABC transporter ATP-binding protein n=1 Tax=Streptomyces tuirus TaxID=68278 RepID=A0A941FBF0_9ACTN|nr:glycine betaine/L-proline ABC transporter ATP-binding protein [Streptomyces tuirus]